MFLWFNLYLTQNSTALEQMLSFLVHYGAGFWGVVAVTLFNKDHSVFYDWDELAFKRLGWNLLGGVVISVWSLFWGLVIFIGLRLFKILRVSQDIEVKG